MFVIVDQATTFLIFMMFVMFGRGRWRKTDVGDTIAKKNLIMGEK